MNESNDNILILDFGEKGGILEFDNPTKIQEWFSEEVTKWQWMNQIAQTNSSFQNLANQQQQIYRFIQSWNQARASNADENPYRNSVKEYIEQSIRQQSIWLSSSPTGSFILKLAQDSSKGPLVAASAYLALGGAYSPINEPIHPKIYEGAIEGFLFKREIDWAATAHRELLEKLKHQYEENLAGQKKKTIWIEKSNKILNDQFSETLATKAKSLDELHSSQVEEFKKLIYTHQTNLESIEKAYDQKLALLKPVKYWNARKISHWKKAEQFAIASLICGVIIFGVLGWLVYEFFVNVPPNERPQVWQIGVFSVAAFFSIWFERILVRLFISNMHLSTDAEERVTMLQTYLSIIRQGSEFDPEDKKLILERLFHPAADGLVKDDGAPPSPLEMLSRR